MILMAGGFQHELRQGNLTGKWSEPLALADSRFQRVDLQPVRSASDCVGTLVRWSLHIISTPKEFGGIDPRFKYEEKAMQQIFAGIECNTLAS